MDLDAVEILDEWLGRQSSPGFSLSNSESEGDNIEMASPPKPNWPTEDGSDSGSVFSNDPEVIVEEEAPIIWRRYPDDPLQREKALDKIYEEKGAEYGDKVRDHMEQIEKERT